MRVYQLHWEYLLLLVGGLEHEFYLSIQLGIIIPTDELIFCRGVGIPPTSLVIISNHESPSIRTIFGMWFMMPQTLLISEGGDGLSVNLVPKFDPHMFLVRSKRSICLMLNVLLGGKRGVTKYYDRILVGLDRWSLGIVWHFDNCQFKCGNNAINTTHI